MNRGFTLLEVLVALLVATLVCGATAAALTSVLRSEDHALRLREAALAADVVGARQYRGAMEEKDLPGVLPEGWVARTSETKTREGQTNRVWRSIEIWREDRPSTGVRLDFPVEGKGEEL